MGHYGKGSRPTPRYGRDRFHPPSKLRGYSAESFINGKTVPTPSFVIMENMLEYAIVGAETMQEIGIVLDFHNDELII